MFYFFITILVREMIIMIGRNKKQGYVKNVNVMITHPPLIDDIRNRLL